MADKVDFLAGEVNGLKAVLLALVSTHPDHETLHEELERLSQIAIGATNATPVSEDYIAGQTQTVKDFKDRVRQLLDR